MKTDPQSLSGHSLLVLSGGERITFISIPEMMFQIFFQILGNMIKVSRPSLFVEQCCAVQSLKRITCDERGKIGRKNLTTFYIKSLAI